MVLPSKVFRESKKAAHIYMKLTICELNRQIYDYVYLEENLKNKDKIIELLEQAYLVGVKMTDKLAEYRLMDIFISPSLGDTPDIKEVNRIRKLRVDLEGKYLHAISNGLRPEQQQADEESV